MGSIVAVKGMLSMKAEAMALTQRIMMMATVRLPGETLSTDLFGDTLDQAGGLGPGDDDEEPDEEHQGGPLHLFLQHLHDVHLGDGQQHHGADEGRHRQLHVQGAVDDEQEDGEAQE